MEHSRLLGSLELRQEGGRPAIHGVFPYGQEAVVSDRGRQRKERIAAHAFRFSVEDLTRDIHLLRGHSFDKPLASRRNGTLELEDRDDALEFVAALPDTALPAYMEETLRMIEADLLNGISPGFRVPPASALAAGAVPEELIPEPGNPGVSIRQINEAVLYELSLVTRPAYQETTLDMRSEGANRAVTPTPPRAIRGGYGALAWP